MSSTGRYVAFLGDSLRVYALDTRELIVALEMVVQAIVFNADDSAFVLRQGKEFQVYTLPDGRVSQLHSNDAATFYGCGPYEQVTWFTQQPRLMFYNADTTRIWDYHTDEITRLDGYAALSPNDRWLAQLHEDRLLLRDPVTLEIVHEWADSGPEMSWSPDSRWLVTYGYDGFASLYDVVAGVFVREMPHHHGFSTCGTFLFPPQWSADGATLVTYEFSSVSVLRVGDRGQVVVQPGQQSDQSLSGLPLYAEADAPIAAEPDTYLPDETEATILAVGEGQGWYFVETDDGLQGWIYEARLNTYFRQSQVAPSQLIQVWHLGAS